MIKKYISNPVFTKIQKGVSHDTVTGTILYANKFADVSQVKMPDNIKEVLDSDLGSVGKNPLNQLRSKLKGLEDGPWYMDCRNGILYIHNRKFNEDVVHNYIYQAENGEVINVHFATRKVQKSLSKSVSNAVDPYTKGLYSSETTQKTNNGIINEERKEPGFHWSGKVEIRDRAASDATSYHKLHKYVTGETLRHIPFYWHGINPKKKITKKPVKHRKAVQRVTSLYYKKYKGNNQAFVKSQREYNINHSSVKSKDAWSQKVISTLTGNQRYNLSDEETVKIYKKGGRKALRKYLKVFFNYAHTPGTHKVLTEVWSAQWVDPSKYKNGTFTGASVSLGPDKDKATRDIGLYSGIYMKNLEKDPNIQVLTPVTVQRKGLLYYYRVKVMKKSYVVKELNSLDLATDWTIRQLRNNGYPNGRKPNKDYSVKIDYGSYKGLGNGGGLASTLASNKGRTIIENKLDATLNVIGRPSLENSQIINISNVGKRWSGNYYIKSVTHNMDSSNGYTCSMELTKNLEESGSESTSNKLSQDDMHTNGTSEYNKFRKCDVTISHPESEKNFKRKVYQYTNPNRDKTRSKRNSKHR
jgi:hypothetical protein